MSNTIKEPVTTAPVGDDQPVVRSLAARRALAVLRIMFGFYFLWAFLDKTFGLGFATPAERAWVNGGSPTRGFLSGVEGPFAGVYQAIAGNAFIDVLFMVGLLGIGLALLLGIGMRVAATAGFVLYLMMWTVALPPENHPFLDEHILGAISMVVLAAYYAGDTWGFGKAWASNKFVKDNPVLR